jgi:hypothetical protein
MAAFFMRGRIDGMKFPYVSFLILACCLTWLILGFSRGDKFSLRKLFVLITVLAIILGVLVWGKGRQARRTIVETNMTPMLVLHAAKNNFQRCSQ